MPRQPRRCVSSTLCSGGPSVNRAVRMPCIRAADTSPGERHPTIDTALRSDERAKRAALRYTRVARSHWRCNVDAPQSHVSASVAARALEVSPSRVRALLSNGALHGHREGGVWLVERKSLVQRSRLGHRGVRPLSQTSADALRGALSEVLAPALGVPFQLDVPDRVARHRARQRVVRLLWDDQPAQLLRSWLGWLRDARQVIAVAPEAMRELEQALAVQVSGVSHPATGIAAYATLEVHGSPADIPELPAGDGELIVHERPWQPADIVVDLALHGGPREDAAVSTMLAETA